MYSPALIERYAHASHAMHAARPTPAQAEAGNYRMGHIDFQGLRISIETPKGRRRRPEWPPMAAHYGYIKGTRGRDGDHLDVFIGPNRSSELVYVVDQSGASGKRFDEHKIMLGYDSQAAAIAAYRACYKPGWTVGPVTAMTIGQFKAWLGDGDHMKPLYRQVSRYSLDSDDRLSRTRDNASSRSCRFNSTCPSPSRMPATKNQMAMSTSISSSVPHLKSAPGFSSRIHQPSSNSAVAFNFSAAASSGDIRKTFKEGAVTRELYSVESDDLYLAPESSVERYEVERYEWNEAAHPRHEAGSAGGIGGQFAPTGQAATGQTSTGNRPGGALSPRMLASAQEKAWVSSDPAKHLQPVEPYKPAAPLTPEMVAAMQGATAQPQQASQLRSTRKREIAALPDTIKPGHALHLSALSTRDRVDLMDWSRRLHEAMGNVKGPNEEAEWQKVNKDHIRAMLDEMNKRDKAARARGVRLSDYINANGLIPEALAARLDGGRRFFDPEYIRDNIKAGNPTPGQAQAVQRNQDAVAAFTHGTREQRKAMLSTPGEIREAIYQAMGLTPGAGLRQDEKAPSLGDMLDAFKNRGKPPKSDAKPPELAHKAPEQPAKPPEQDSIAAAIKTAFDQFSKRDQKKIDAAIRGGDESMSSDFVSGLRDEVIDTWRQMTEQAHDHNNAIRQIMGQFSKHWGLVSAALAQGRDYDKIRGFDQMTDYARAHFPQVLAQGKSESDSGADDEALAKALREGLKPVPKPWDDEVIAKTQQRVGAMVDAAMAGDHREYPEDPNDPDYVPFSARSIVDEVMRYWLAAEGPEKICA